MDEVDFSILQGLTLISIEKTETEDNGDKLVFKTDTRTFEMYHHQNCCEHVYLEDIDNDLHLFLNTPILLAEESFNSETDEDDYLTGWTFYKLSVMDNDLCIRWQGRSNGYYGVGASFYEL